VRGWLRYLCDSLGSEDAARHDAVRSVGTIEESKQIANDAQFRRHPLTGAQAMKANERANPGAASKGKRKAAAVARMAKPSVLPGGGGPLMIDIDLIDEDPAQPRSKNNPGFRTESIAELAASYGPKGPKTPLSLRIHPDSPGRYIINHGHRRYRAGKVKGLTALPAFIDNEYDDADQVIENLQRENMTPREIADYVGRELAKGKKKREIAARIGKSASFISQHVTLLDLPEPVAVAFRSGRVNDGTVVNDRVSAFTANPTEVTHWLNNPSQEMTRGEVRLLREFLTEKRRNSTAQGDVDGQFDNAAAVDGQGAALDLAKDHGGTAQRSKKVTLKVEHEGRAAQLLLGKRPLAAGRAWLKFEYDGQVCDVALAGVRLVAILAA
jgi:ParB family chromosome partitioning protein